MKFIWSDYLRQRKINKLKRRIAGVKERIATWREIYGRLDSCSGSFVMNLAELSAQKAELEEELNQLVNG